MARAGFPTFALPPVSRAEGERLRSLAAMARALGRSGGVLDVVERDITEGCRVVDADSGSVSVLDRPAGLVRVLVNVGALSPQEEPRPRDAPARLDVPEQSTGPHLAYAVQWFLFALMALGAYVVLARREAADRRAAAAGAAPVVSVRVSG